MHNSEAQLGTILKPQCDLDNMKTRLGNTLMSSIIAKY